MSGHGASGVTSSRLALATGLHFLTLSQDFSTLRRETEVQQVTCPYGLNSARVETPPRDMASPLPGSLGQGPRTMAVLRARGKGGSLTSIQHFLGKNSGPFPFFFFFSSGPWVGTEQLRGTGAGLGGGPGLADRDAMRGLSSRAFVPGLPLALPPRARRSAGRLCRRGRLPRAGFVLSAQSSTVGGVPGVAKDRHRHLSLCKDQNDGGGQGERALMRDEGLQPRREVPGHQVPMR